MRRFLSKKLGKKPETVLQKNRRMLLKARKEKLAIFKSVKMSPTAKKIVKKSIKAVLATGLEFPTYAERRARMKTILKTCIVEAAKASKISKKDRKILFELSELFPQQINEKNQPKKVLEGFKLTERENTLVKSLKPETIAEIKRTLYRVLTKIQFEKEPKGVKGYGEKARLEYFIKKMEFMIVHDIGHATANFERFTQAAK